MNNTQGTTTMNNKINIWGSAEYIKKGWKWLIGGAAIGIAGALGFIALTPAKYEAIALIQPATIGTIGGAPSIVEPVEHTLERLRLASFYTKNVVQTCQVDSARELANNVKVALIKNSKLFRMSYQAKSPLLAEACATQIAERLIQSQAAIAAPLVKELEDQLMLTKNQIAGVERILAQNDKQIARSPIFNESSTLFLLSMQSQRDNLLQLQKLYREQSLQLTAPLTQSTKLLEPIYASDKAVYPKKLVALMSGLVVGLLAGALTLFIRRG